MIDDRDGDMLHTAFDDVANERTGLLAR